MQTRISENPMNTRKKIVAAFITIGIAPVSYTHLTLPTSDLV